MRLFIFFCSLSLILAACQRQEETPPPSPEKPAAATATPAAAAPDPTPTAAPDETPVATAPAEWPAALLTASMPAALVESPALALPLWRQFQGQKPPLVLLANQPFLAPVSEPLRAESLRLARSADAGELAGKATALTAAPVFLPGMTVRLALEADLLSGLVWVFPSRSDTEQLNLDLFRAQLRDTGLITEDEANSIALRDGVFSGIIAGKPFQSMTIDHLPALATPVLLHIDLSYFQPLYKGEIKTPLYPLLTLHLSALREQAWPTYAISVSTANLDEGLPLATRFIGADLATFFTNPAYLSEAIPELWEYRAQALFVENFLQKDRLRESFLAMEQLAPHDPAVKYALYAVARQFNEGNKSLDYLRQAVELDPIYALEYLTLADLARSKNAPPAKVIEMLSLARRSFPNNPFIALHLYQAQLTAGEEAAAQPLLRELQALPWSAIYYPSLPSSLTTGERR